MGSTKNADERREKRQRDDAPPSQKRWNYLETITYRNILFSSEIIQGEGMVFGRISLCPGSLEGAKTYGSNICPMDLKTWAPIFSQMTRRGDVDSNMSGKTLQLDHFPLTGRCVISQRLNSGYSKGVNPSVEGLSHCRTYSVWFPSFCW